MHWLSKDWIQWFIAISHRTSMPSDCSPRPAAAFGSELLTWECNWLQEWISSTLILPQTGATFATPHLLKESILWVIGFVNTFFSTAPCHDDFGHCRDKPQQWWPLLIWRLCFEMMSQMQSLGLLWLRPDLPPLGCWRAKMSFLSNHTSYFPLRKRLWNL